MPEKILNTVPEAIEELKKGKLIIVVDDEDRENEGDFVIAAEFATPEIVNFMSTVGKGLLCVTLTGQRCKELSLPQMVENPTALKGTAFTVSVDLIGQGCTTGISAHDRSATIRALVDSKTKPEDLGRPGHIFPIRAEENGVFQRPGHTEASVDLCLLANLKPGAAIVEIINQDGTMARLNDLLLIAQKYNLAIISVQDIIKYRKSLA